MPECPCEPTSITYDDFMTLVSGDGLLAGTFYLINDFRTNHIIPNTAVTNTGSTEPIIVEAASTNTINYLVISTVFPTDEIHYELVDSTTAGGDRGRIYYRKDTTTINATSYDWRVVLFRRWETAPSSGIFTILTDNSGSFQDFFTFNNSASASGCEKNQLGPITDKGISFFAAPTDKLNNFVFNCIAYDNIYDNDCFDNTITGVMTVANNVLLAFYQNTIGDNFIGNRIASGFSFNEIGDGFSTNVIEDDFSLNQIGDGFEGNRILTNFANNTIGTAFSQNNIEDAFANNIIGDDFSNNTYVGDGFDSNLIGNSFTSNTSIGSGFGSNFILDNFQNNDIDFGFFQNGSLSTPIDVNFSDNEIGSNFVNNTNIAANFSFNHVESSLNGIDFTGATLVYNAHTKDIFIRNDFSFQLSYTDNTNTIQYAVVNA